MARRIADSIGPAHKLLLTATPLQNSLMELYGLVSVIDEHVFGDAASFRDQFVKTGSEVERNTQLRSRLMPVCIRTLRKQVVEYIPYTNRIRSRRTSRRATKNTSFTRACRPSCNEIR